MTNKSFRANGDDPWTKELILGQIWIQDPKDEDVFDKPLFTVNDITDEDAQWWVDAEFAIRDTFPSEEDYHDEIESLNEALNNRIMKRV